MAGGLIGATVGSFMIHRHQRAESGAAFPKAELSLFPIHNGLGIAARFRGAGLDLDGQLRSVLTPTTMIS